ICSRTTSGVAAHTLGKRMAAEPINIAVPGAGGRGADIPPFPLTLWLVHPDAAACDAFARRFAGLGVVRVVRGRFEDLEPHDAFVTAGNAFGIMTAGIDAAVVREFGPGLMRRVQDRILDDYLGEQPVG